MQQTIVALFNQRVEAERAREDLQNAGLSISDMHLISGGETPSGHFAQPAEAEGSEPRGFFDWLFGSDVPQAEVERYHSYVNQGGKTLLSLRATGGEIEFERIVSILDQHYPIDIGEDADGLVGETAAGPGDTAPTSSQTTTPTASSETVIPTAREELQVGKREAMGTHRYRVRSYVVERPVEEQVELRDETVTVERRAPARPAGEGGFEEKEVEVTERREEPVVAKVVKPGEDVVVRKDAADRVEKVRDTVRETKVDIDRAAAGDKPAGAIPGAQTEPASSETAVPPEPGKRNPD